jgi:putative component of membrane protein insertase Oxa1/YidC/SpoIIIJ protein YidD
MDHKTNAKLVLNNFRKMRVIQKFIKVRRKFSLEFLVICNEKCGISFIIKKNCRILELCRKEQEKLVAGGSKTEMGVMRFIRIIRCNT